jgi:Ca2+-binding RTX toxin-like protein
LAIPLFPLEQPADASRGTLPTRQPGARGGSGADSFFFNIHQENTGVDHITDFDVNRDTIDIRYQDGYTPSITMTVGNYNLVDMSADVLLHMTDASGEAGTIILDHLSLGDIGDVMGQIHLQEVA